MQSSTDTSARGTYTFDEVDAELRLLPMAARRALDVAGVHLSLVEWQRLSLQDRRALIACGAASRVDVTAVRALLGGVEVREQSVRPDPDASEPPREVVEALAAPRAMPKEVWVALHPLDRYVLAQLAKRGRVERLLVAFDEIAAMRGM